jgi:hypothetical protein
MKDIIETWEIHNKINLYLLESIAESAFSAITKPFGTKTLQIV